MVVKKLFGHNKVMVSNATLLFQYIWVGSTNIGTLSIYPSKITFILYSYSLAHKYLGEDFDSPGDIEAYKRMSTQTEGLLRAPAQAGQLASDAACRRNKTGLYSSIQQARSGHKGGSRKYVLIRIGGGAKKMCVKISTKKTKG